MPGNMTLSHLVQNNNTNVTGSFNAMGMDKSFNGVVDVSRHFLFTIPRGAGELPLFFNGTVKSDGSIAGTFCTIDSAGQCVGGNNNDYGQWSVIQAS
jgi:hypothetical protein